MGTWHQEGLTVGRNITVTLNSTSNIEILERFQSKAYRLTEGISNHQQLKKKSAATALNTEYAQTT
jgi:hypothetical protein